MFYNFQQNEVVNPLQHIRKVIFINPNSESSIMLQKATFGIDGFVTPTTEWVHSEGRFFISASPTDVFGNQTTYVKWKIPGYSGVIQHPSLRQYKVQYSIGFRIEGDLMLVGMFIGD